MKSRIFERLRELIRGEKQLSLEREFPVNYEDFKVSWSDYFEQRVIKELIQDPKRERMLREKDIQNQDRLNRERIRKIQEQRETYNND
jgi:hypothetical protein